MKKLLPLLALLFALGAGAQVNDVRHDITEYNGQKYPCFAYEFSGAAALVEEAVKEKMLTTGNKTENGPRGWMVYRSILVPNETGRGLQDVFIRVDEKSRKEKDKTLIYVIATKPGEIADEKVKKTDRSVMAAEITLSPSGSALISSLSGDIAQKIYQAALLAQEQLVMKEEKTLRSLKEEEAKLEKRLAELKADLAKNVRDQESQVAVVAKEKTKFEEMKAKKTPDAAKPN